ncbi:helix-turn-helix domain-containing protein [Agrobacterium tumefaciens]|uniref:helix-turn-helix domain-containing protein n=1 Tax=Agrobacterium tumefaciens TaxID=358 RepID=UPI001FCB89E4
MDEQQAMREAIAKEYGITLYRQYGEDQAAHLINIDRSTLKRWRRKGLTPFVALGPRKIRYLGIHIVDLLRAGVKDDG